MMKQYIAPEMEKIEFAAEEILGPSETFIEKEKYEGTTGTTAGPNVPLWLKRNEEHPIFGCSFFYNLGKNTCRNAQVVL